MRSYSTDSDERTKLPLFMVAGSIFLAWALHNIIVSLPLTVPWWIDVPSVAAIYPLLYYVFNRWLWQVPVLHTLGAIAVPNLNGRWTGYLTSSFDEHAARYEVTVEIKQEWTNISIVLRASESQSYSEAAAVLTRNPAGALLIYEYVNEPRVRAKATMSSHRGTARLELAKKSDGIVLDGDYYTGRGRQNIGALHIELQR